MKTLFQILFAIVWLYINVCNVSAQQVKTEDTLIGTIDKEVAEIEAFWSQHKDKQKKYIIEEHNKRLELVKVSDETASDDTEVSYYLLFNENSQLLSHTEVPTSMSGDWYMEKTHYFDRDVRTIMFKNYSYHYNSRCTFLLNVTTRYYFDSQFRVIKKITEYTDNDNKAITNPSKCEQYGTDEKDEDVMQPNYACIQKRIEQNLIRYKKERIKQRIDYAQMQKKWNKHMDSILFENMEPIPFQRQHEIYLPQIQKKSNKHMDRLRLQWAKQDEEHNRQVQQEHIKDIICTTLYTISALSILSVIILLIRKRIKKAEGS